MRKSFMLLGVVLCIIMVGCSNGELKTRTLDLSNYKNSEGSYEFTDIPSGSTPKEVEKILGLSLEQPSYTTEQGTDTYTIKNLYHYDEKPVMMRLDFKEDQLESTIFSIAVEGAEAENLFSEISDSFVELYGEETDVMEDSAKLEELNNMTLDTKIMCWDATENGQKTSLQLMFMNSNSSKSTIMIGVGELEGTL